MFEHKVAENAISVTNEDQQLLDFIAIYSRFLQDALRVADLINQGKATNHDKYRMRLFETKIDTEWRRIPEGKRETLARALLAKKLLPEEVGFAMNVFDAQVVRLV